MQVSLVVVLCACAAAASDVVPLQLAQPLPALDHPPQQSVNIYHEPFGVPEATRVAALEAAGAAAEAEAGSRPGVKIVGGLASYNGEHPFMAGLVITLSTGETSICGGSLVTSARVLTAAACYWDGVNQASSMLVVLGSVTLFSGGTRVYASYITVHGGYSPANIPNNIALLQIPYQPTTSYVKPIVMASGSEQFVGYRAEAIGYGRTTNTAPITTAASLRDVFVDVLSNAACAAYYGAAVSGAVLCSAGAGGRNPCGGDQGGPLILYSAAGNDLLLGVYTFGSSSGCQAGLPSGYMRLSYYYPWVYANL